MLGVVTVILDIFDVIFFPVDSVGGMPGLLVQTLVVLCVGAIPGMALRVGVLSVSLLWFGFFLLVLSLPLALSIGILVYCIGVLLIGISAGSALHETIRQMSHADRH